MITGHSKLNVFRAHQACLSFACNSFYHWKDAFYQATGQTFAVLEGLHFFFFKWPLLIHHNIKTNIKAKCNIKAINLLSSGQVFVILPFTEWQTLPLGCWCLDWASCLFFLNAVSVDYVTMRCPSFCHLGLLLVKSVAEQFFLYCLLKEKKKKKGRFCYIVLTLQPFGQVCFSRGFSLTLNVLGGGKKKKICSLILLFLMSYHSQRSQCAHNLEKVGNIFQYISKLKAKW